MFGHVSTCVQAALSSFYPVLPLQTYNIHFLYSCHMRTATHGGQMWTIQNIVHTIFSYVINS